MDSTTKGHETAMIVSAATFYSGSGCSRHVHDSSMLARHAPRFLNTVFLRGIPLLQYAVDNYFYRRLVGGSKESIYSSRPFHIFFKLTKNFLFKKFFENFFKLTNKLCQVSLDGGLLSSISNYSCSIFKVRINCS